MLSLRSACVLSLLCLSALPFQAVGAHVPHRPRRMLLTMRLGPVTEYTVYCVYDFAVLGVLCI